MATWTFQLSKMRRRSKEDGEVGASTFNSILQIYRQEIKAVYPQVQDRKFHKFLAEKYVLPYLWPDKTTWEADWVRWFEEDANPQVEPDPLPPTQGKIRGPKLKVLKGGMKLYRRMTSVPQRLGKAQGARTELAAGEAPIAGRALRSTCVGATTKHTALDTESLSEEKHLSDAVQLLRPSRPSAADSLIDECLNDFKAPHHIEHPNSEQRVSKTCAPTQSASPEHLQSRALEPKLPNLRSALDREVDEFLDNLEKELAARPSKSPQKQSQTENVRPKGSNEDLFSDSHKRKSQILDHETATLDGNVDFDQVSKRRRLSTSTGGFVGF